MLPNNKKRPDRPGGDDEKNQKGNSGPKDMEVDDAAGDLVFEDPFGDDYDEEDVAAVKASENVDNEEDEEDEDERDFGDNAEANTSQTRIWRPDVDGMEEGDTLEYDPSAYIMYHALTTEWPCLSFDFVKDNLGDGRQRFPLTMYAVCGSQADRADKNKLTLLKLSDLHKTQVKDDSDEESGDEEDDDHVDDDPTIEHIDVKHAGGVNRVRVMPQGGASGATVAASMADSGAVHLFDLSACARSMMQKGPRAPAPTKPAFSFRGHREEGFAVDWSASVAGQLATGDCSGFIHVWRMDGGGGGTGSWTVDAAAYRGHKDSVEDIQWSPSEGSVFCSCSADKSVRIWDTRARAPQISLEEVHATDVNVLSWNRHVAYLLASGADDGSFKVWDLRTVGSGSASPLAHFTYHKAAVTSLEWAPHDESVLCVSSADDQVTVWDLSVEPDDEALAEAGGGAALPDAFPPQLLFIHQGQREVKELHFHPQIPGVLMTTAEDGLNVFKPAITAS